MPRPDLSASAAGLRNSISRTLLFIRNESVTRRSLNSLMMSPLSRLRWRGRERRIGAVAQRRVVDDDVLRVDRLARFGGAEEAEQAAVGSQQRDSAVASACAAGRSR